MEAINKKATIKAQYKQHETDTGSVELQIALLTHEINTLNLHFMAHPHDFGSKRGQLVKVGRRQSFLSYIKKNKPAKYKELISSLGIRK